MSALRYRTICADCRSCAAAKRRTSIFAGLSAEELRVLRAAARPSTPTTEEE